MCTLIIQGSISYLWKTILWTHSSPVRQTKCTEIELPFSSNILRLAMDGHHDKNACLFVCSLMALYAVGCILQAKLLPRNTQPPQSSPSVTIRRHSGTGIAKAKAKPTEYLLQIPVRSTLPLVLLQIKGY